MTQEVQLQWGSHQPALMACLACTTGWVMEVGMGHFSTPLLQAYCSNADRRLISLEKDLEWITPFHHLPHRNQIIQHVESYTDVVGKAMSEMPWSVCFIDPSDEMDRMNVFKLALPACQFVVVHDYHNGVEEKIATLLNGVNHFVYRKYDPPTLIASMKRDPKALFI